MDATLAWLLLLVAAALIGAGATRFDLLAARWRELTGRAAPVRGTSPAPRTPPSGGWRPHEAPAQKPAFHRNGRRH